MTARALWFEAPSRAAIRDEPLIDRGDGWRRITAIASAISPGTERLVATGLSADCDSRYHYWDDALVSNSPLWYVFEA